MWMLIVCSCFCCGPGLRDPLSFDQAAILANGDWVADGFRISDYPADGPLANLERHVGGTQYRGIADPVIPSLASTEIRLPVGMSFCGCSTILSASDRAQRS